MGLARMMAMLGLDTSQYEAGFKRVESFSTGAAKRLGSSVKGYLAAAFSVGAVTAYARSIVQWADNLQDLSDDYKISTQTLQEWGFAAAGTRAKTEDFIKAFQYLSKMNPGLSSSQVMGIFNLTADQFKRGELTLGQLIERLGKGAAVLAGPFSNGLRESADEARRLNRILSEDQVAAIGKVGDAWDRLLLKAKAYFAGIIADVVDYPGLQGEATKRMESLPMSERIGPGADRARQQIIDQIKRDRWIASFERDWEQALNVGQSGLPPMAKEPAKFDWARGSGGNVAIGAYSGVNPLIVAQKETNGELKKINKTLERIQADGSIPQ